MAIQANIYPENLGIPISSQEYFFNNNNAMNNYVNNNNLLNEFGYNNLQQLQYQKQQLQQHQTMLMHLHNMQKKKSSMNIGSYEISQPWKKQKLANNSITTTASTTTSECDNNMSMNLSRGFSDEFENQEINRFITIQNERLKMALQAQRKQQFATIVKALEAKTLQLLAQKDEEIAQATKKSIEFQDTINKLELENQAWQRIALENESIVYTLNNTLEQLKQQQELQQQLQQVDCESSSSSNQVDDAESCCNILEKNEKIMVETEEKNRGNNMCKVCNIGNACVLMLPCRHLCSCKVCDAVIDACPVCKSSKMASIEVLIS